MPTSERTTPEPYGTTANIIRAKVKAKIGPIKKTVILACEGRIVSLLKSFKPSLKGCKRPQNPTTLGPFLNWIDPRIFLSTSVT